MDLAHVRSIEALILIQQYMDGWKHNDLDRIVSCLVKDCIVIESHEPMYDGVNDIEKWFKFWEMANSKILKWQIIAFNFCDNEKIAFDILNPTVARSFLSSMQICLTFAART